MKLATGWRLWKPLSPVPFFPNGPWRAAEEHHTNYSKKFPSDLETVFTQPTSFWPFTNFLSLDSFWPRIWWRGRTRERPNNQTSNFRRKWRWHKSPNTRNSEFAVRKKGILLLFFFCSFIFLLSFYFIFCFPIFLEKHEHIFSCFELFFLFFLIFFVVFFSFSFS